MKVALIGSEGQLGRDVRAAFERAGDEVVPLDHAAIELAELDSVATALNAVTPDVVVNTAAMHQVEDCERDPLRAFAVNAIGSQNLALVCGDLDRLLIHVSTDYVFDGMRRTPYIERDLALPLNVYGTSKLAGEQMIQAVGGRHLILRTSGLYGRHRCRAKGRNFVETMFALAETRPTLRVVDDERLTPTATVSLARQIERLKHHDGYGVVHATAHGACSWYEFACAIFRLAGRDTAVEPAEPGEFPAKVNRPAYSVLDNRELRLAELDVMRPWQDDLAEHLEAGVHA